MDCKSPVRRWSRRAKPKLAFRMQTKFHRGKFVYPPTELRISHLGSKKVRVGRRLPFSLFTKENNTTLKRKASEEDFTRIKVYQQKFNTSWQDDTNNNNNLKYNLKLTKKDLQPMVTIHSDGLLLHNKLCSFEIKSPMSFVQNDSNGNSRENSLFDESVPTCFGKKIKLSDNSRTNNSPCTMMEKMTRNPPDRHPNSKTEQVVNLSPSWSPFVYVKHKFQRNETCKDPHNSNNNVNFLYPNSKIFGITNENCNLMTLKSVKFVKKGNLKVTEKETDMTLKSVKFVKKGNLKVTEKETDVDQENGKLFSISTSRDKVKVESTENAFQQFQGFTNNSFGMKSMINDNDNHLWRFIPLSKEPVVFHNYFAINKGKYSYDTSKAKLTKNTNPSEQNTRNFTNNLIWKKRISSTSDLLRKDFNVRQMTKGEIDDITNNNDASDKFVSCCKTDEVLIDDNVIKNIQRNKLILVAYVMSDSDQLIPIYKVSSDQDKKSGKHLGLYEQIGILSSKLCDLSLESRNKSSLQFNVFSKSCDFESKLKEKAQGLQSSTNKHYHKKTENEFSLNERLSLQCEGESSKTKIKESRETFPSTSERDDLEDFVSECRNPKTRALKGTLQVRNQKILPITKVSKVGNVETINKLQNQKGISRFSNSSESRIKAEKENFLPLKLFRKKYKFLFT